MIKPRIKKNKGNKYFFNDCHREGLGAGGAGLAHILPKTGLSILLCALSIGKPVNH